MPHPVAMSQEAPRPTLPAVAIVAADRRVRDSLASVLDATGRVRLVGSVGDAPAAVRLVEAGHAEVIVVDPSPAGGGTEDGFLPMLRRAAPDARILLIEWGAPGARTRVPAAADAVLNPAQHPMALIDAVLAPRRADD